MVGGKSGVVWWVSRVVGEWCGVVGEWCGG